ncbi:MAG: hypothetical protein HN712_12815 [Gemmatimonadetes bacterium]|nr:hypothetical protein [Gemmatimonadota bacterium]
MPKWSRFAGLLLVLFAACDEVSIHVPYLPTPPVIDADLSEWRQLAYTGGPWDIERLSQMSWYNPERNRLTIHTGESAGEIDLQASYYVAWDDEYLYLGAEVLDNINDVIDPAHEDKRWYFKDCICWFVEAPRDETSEHFEQGDNALCFLIDDSRPTYGAWWRHGAPDRSYVEEPLPAGSFDYELRFDPWDRSPADFVLEARIQMAPLFGRSDPSWTPPASGDVYGLEIVHTDPDGEDYGGHLLIYGDGDDDSTWGQMVLVDETP